MPHFCTCGASAAFEALCARALRWLRSKRRNGCPRPWDPELRTRTPVVVLEATQRLSETLEPRAEHAHSGGCARSAETRCALLDLVVNT